jgi:hypothetical protein
MEGFLIAIDGPAGSGKSSVARAVAQRLGIVNLNTGAAYRAVALVAAGMVGICEALEPTSDPARIDCTNTCQVDSPEAKFVILHGYDSGWTTNLPLDDFLAVSIGGLQEVALACRAIGVNPWEVIEARVRAAADGDFVVAFYNPRSRARQDHLSRALAILSQKRPPQTPVVVASNLGRAEERIEIVDLGSFDPSTVDMLTVVLVGASTSRTVSVGDGKTWAYTPRGYAVRRRAAE